jgi:hypothetical protein
MDALYMAKSELEDSLAVQISNRIELENQFNIKISDLVRERERERDVEQHISKEREFLLLGEIERIRGVGLNPNPNTNANTNANTNPMGLYSNLIDEITRVREREISLRELESFMGGTPCIPYINIFKIDEIKSEREKELTLLGEVGGLEKELEELKNRSFYGGAIEIENNSLINALSIPSSNSNLNPTPNLDINPTSNPNISPNINPNISPYINPNPNPLAIELITGYRNKLSLCLSEVAVIKELLDDQRNQHEVDFFLSLVRLSAIFLQFLMISFYFFYFFIFFIFFFIIFEFFNLFI